MAINLNADGLCRVDDCPEPPRTPGSDICKKHYMRRYRHGDVNKTATRSGITASQGRRYKRVNATAHPLADRYGRAYEHRIVLYDTIGPGPHPCHWCKTPVKWGPLGPGCLQVDHIDGIGDNNAPDNLVPSCNACNIARARQATERLLRTAGWYSVHPEAKPIRPRRQQHGMIGAAA